MWTWLALLGTPSIALLNLGVVFALASPSCALQTTAWLHGVHAVSTAASAVATAMAWRDWRRHGAAGTEDAAADTATRQRFTASLAAWVGLLFTLVTLAQWFVAAVLSPCVS